MTAPAAVLVARAPTRLARPSVPWRPADATRLFLLNGVGAFVVLLAWVGCGGTARLSHQFAWTSLGVVGFLTAAVGNGLWLLTGRRMVGVRLRQLLPLEAELDMTEPGSRAVPATADPLTYDPELLVAAEGGSRYHRPDCVLVRGKELETGSRSSFFDSPRTPCEVCEP